MDIRLLLQPEHAHLAERYLEATKIALRTYGTWSAPYPYPQITVVDPAYGSASGGMEYPTLFTGGTAIVAPRGLQSPEGVTIHEAGHQFWYGLVANNEFEEAWLDEGFNTYMTSKATDHALGPEGWGRRGFGLRRPRASPIPRGAGEAGSACARAAKADVMAKKAWTYRDGGSYGLNSYGKPALVLQTLEGLLGEETMVKVLRTYARRFRFAHPTTEDFIATVDEVTGAGLAVVLRRDLLLLEPVRLRRRGEERAGAHAARLVRGEGREAGAEAARSTARKRRSDGPHESRRHRRAEGRGAAAPSSSLVEFADGRTVSERWDGRDRWVRFRYEGAKVVSAAVDPATHDRDRRRPLQQRLDLRPGPGPAGGHEVGRAVPLLAPEPPGAARPGGVRPC